MYNTPLNPPTTEDAIYQLTHCSIKDTLSAIQPTDLHAVLRTVWPSLQLLHDDKAIDIIAAAIARTVQQVAVAQPMDADKVRRAAYFIWEDYRHLSIEDVMLCLKMGVKGQLTPFYGRLDAQVIYDWFHEYNIQRDEAARLELLRMMD